MTDPLPVFVFLPKPSTAEAYQEIHPYGPVSDGNFNTDLKIGIDFAECQNSPALAVVKGKVVFIPDSSDASKGTLLLIPWFDDLQALHTVLGITNMVFVYRNIDRDSIRLYLESKFDIALKVQRSRVRPSHRDNVISLEEAMTSFLNGQYYSPLINAGDELGLPTLAEGGCVLGFEIVLLPGAYRGMPGLDRIKQLVDPANDRTRRLDPVSFYDLVAGDASEVVDLAPEHHDHPILMLVTKRTLLEVRNEYDRPWTGTLEIEFEGITIPHTFSVDNRGTAIVAFASPPTPPPTGNYTFSLTNHTFTALPSGGFSRDSFAEPIDPPDHLAVQTIFMADVNDSDNWFVSNTDPPQEFRLPRFTPNNKVTYLIDGITTFREMVHAMRSIQFEEPDHFLRLAGWWLSTDFEMIPLHFDTTFLQLIQEMAKDSDDPGPGGGVRSLLWSQLQRFDLPTLPPFAAPILNSESVNKINALPGNNGRAILDQELLESGSHHQKLLIANGNFGAVAFCGGIDINPNRLDTQTHDAKSPYHDIHAKVEGPAVADLNRTFVQRWNHHPDVTGGGTHPQIPPSAPPHEEQPGTHYVQVTRTYAPRMNYPFAPGGDLGTLNAVRRAIQRAQKFIYLEDQYGTPYAGPDIYDESKDDLGILGDLLEALDRIEYLIIVLCNHAGQPQGRYRRYNFIKALKDKAKDKVHVFYLERGDKKDEVPTQVNSTALAAFHMMSGDVSDPDVGTLRKASGGPKYPNEIYVHTKTWIVDDVYVKIGSCNCNRRGFTYDSEGDLHIIDGALLGGGRDFARRYRRELWAEHLNLEGTYKHLLDDPAHALFFWLHPPSGAHIRTYNEKDYKRPKFGGNFRWNTYIDPDGR